VIGARRIIGHIFYDGTVNSGAMYVFNILNPFFGKRTEERRLYGVFQQECSAAYMADTSSEAL
jgi:hypothetical protein